MDGAEASRPPPIEREAATSTVRPGRRPCKDAGRLLRRKALAVHLSPTSPRRWRSLITPVAVVAITLAVGWPTPASSGVADDRFDQLTGPFGGFVVRPADFGLDATEVLADVPGLLQEVDGDRARALVEALAVPRGSTGPPANLEAATDLVAATFDDAGHEPQFQPVVHGSTGIDMPNVYAELPGTQCPEKVLVVGAHYDARPDNGAGADDNASGVAGLFELARALQDDPLPVTVRFAAWSYEEDGLLGSRAMVARDLAEGTDVVGAVSLEMIGFTKPEIDPLTGIEASYLAMITDPAGAPLARAFAAAAYTYTPEFPAFGAVVDPGLLPDIYRSDHASYALNGFPGLMATDTANFRNPNYHTINDTPATLDWDFLTSSARAALAGTATYGSSDQDADGLADLCGVVPAAPLAPATSAPLATVDRRSATPRFTG